MATRPNADPEDGPTGPAASIPGHLGLLLLAGAVLLGPGCGGRGALLEPVKGAVGSGATDASGSTGGNPGTSGAGTGGSWEVGGAPGTGGTIRPEVGGGGSTGGAGKDQDAGGARDAAPDGAADARIDTPAGRPDGHGESGRGLKLVAGAVGGPGYVDGIGAAARFRSPRGIVSDGAGNLFIADSYDHTIRKVVIATGEVTTLAGSPGEHGSGDGTGAAACFYFPAGIASDGAGNLLVADSNNDTIRKVVIATGEVTTLAGSPMQFGSADGKGPAASFYFPAGIASDGAGNLFVADSYNHAIRKVVVATGEVTTVAGAAGWTGDDDGFGSAARFYYPMEVAIDGTGNLFVADGHGQTIRKVVIATGEVTTLAGLPGQAGSSDGTGAAARFDNLHGIVSDGAGNLFVADSENQLIRKVVVATGAVTTFAGSLDEAESSDGTGAAARFRYPYGVARDGAGNLFVTDSDNHTIRKVVLATGAVSTLAGSPRHAGSTDGTGAAARFARPHGVAGDGAGNLFLADSDNHTIRKVVVATAQVATLAGLPEQAGATDGTGTAARFNFPNGIASDGAGDIFVADADNHTIRKVVIATGEVTTLAGLAGSEGSRDGRGSGARFSHPQDVASDGAGSLFVADTDNHTIRKVNLATGQVTTLAGSAGQWGSHDGTGALAEFDMPYGITSDRAGNLFVADFGNYTIRRVVIATGEVTTVAGSPQQAGSSDGAGADALFSLPTGIASDGAGSLFVADRGNYAIRKIVVATRTVTTVVGSPDHAGVLLGPLPAGLKEPWGLAPGPAGELYISDAEENAILVAEF